jgi:hypothetical protein
MDWERIAIILISRICGTKIKNMKYEDLKEALGELIHQCTYENFCMGYDPIIDLISNEEKKVLNDLELNFSNFNSIKIGTQESYELMDFLYYLNPGDPYYMTMFTLDFYGNLFFYSKFEEDLFNGFGKNELEQRTGFLDFDYHYLLDIFIMSNYTIEEDNEIQACLDLVEDEWGIFEDED